MEYKTNNAGINIINENKKIEIIKSKSLEDIINTDDIINFISSSFYSIIHNNKIMKKKQARVDEPLFSKNVPVLNLNKYLVRIIKYTEIENNTLIVAYLYIIKLIKKENFVLGINNVYRLLLGAVVLAKKVLEDIKLYNSYYCDIGGISNKELNLIEYNIFTRIDFDVNLKMDDVNKVYVEIFEGLPQSRLEEIFKTININNDIFNSNSININKEDIKQEEHNNLNDNNINNKEL
jgi:hypothetical protein